MKIALRAAFMFLGIVELACASVPVTSAAQSRASRGDQSLEEEPVLELAPVLPLERGVGTESGKAARFLGGRVGERQESNTVIGIDPTARIANRIPNRLNLRLRTRIDRYYSSEQGLNETIKSNEAETRRARNSSNGRR